MNSKISTILLFTLVFNVVFGAQQDTQKPSDSAEQETVIQLPEKNTPKYWNVRSEAISELLPFLTKKRSETKTLQKLLADYLIKIGKGSDFTSQNIPVPEDPNVYFEILRIGQGLKDMNIPRPKKRPSWEDIMEVAMKHVVFEGYLPTQVEEGEDLTQFVAMCKNKEQYGQKVRRDLRAVADQCARMWVYLESINKKDAFKVGFADLQLEQQAQKAQARAQYKQAHQEQVISQAQRRQERQFEDREARASFNSSRRQQTFESRQSRLNSRAANSGINVFY